MSKKVKFFFLKKNPIELCFIDFINYITIEDFIIINNEEEIYVPKETLFLRSLTTITNKTFDIFIDDNKLGDNLVGIYAKAGDYLTWNKGEGNFVNFDMNSIYEIRGNTLRLELVNETGQIFNLEDKRLKILLIVSHDIKN